VRDSANESKPGEKYRYSNAGYSMLAAVVEIISGKSFENFLLENIFEPCKMKSTGYPWELRMNKSLFATGHNSKHQAIAPEQNVWAARGSGNLVTNGGDLYK
jgi:CubicO group peptidase (beta-lactamase class C family)